MSKLRCSQQAESMVTLLRYPADELCWVCDDFGVNCDVRSSRHTPLPYPRRVSDEFVLSFTSLRGPAAVPIGRRHGKVNPVDVPENSWGVEPLEQRLRQVPHCKAYEQHAALVGLLEQPG